MKSASQIPAEGASSRGAYADVINLVASGRATSRIAISRALGIAPSTAAIRVQALIDAGLVQESGSATSTGGRRPRTLALTTDNACVLAVDLGGSHARIALVDLTGALLKVDEIPLTISDGPEVVLPIIVEAALALAEREGKSAQVRGVGLALPGPVNVETGSLTLPSRMRGWTGFPVRDWIAERYGLSVSVDNDANLMAYGEQVARGGDFVDTVTVKAGSGIGSGIIVDGRIHRGSTSAAGDITHVRIDAAQSRPCSCGNLGCLETVASGSALVKTLVEQGLDVHTTAEVVVLAQQGHPLATTAVRSAGAHLGQVLCAVTNFFNPSAIYLGGLLSTVEPFVAAVRSELYQGSHPLVTQNLAIERTLTDRDGTLLGAAQLAIENTLDQALPQVESATS